jgi:predicted outer membrane repeat protein
MTPGLVIEMPIEEEIGEPLPIYESETGASVSPLMYDDTFNDPRSYIDYDQSVIAPADADKLTLIVQRLNSNTLHNPHQVYLLEGIYNVTQPLVVRGQYHRIVIQGQGANLTVLQPAYNFNPYSILTVTEYAELQVRHLTIQNGNADRGGAIAIDRQSHLTIYGSRFSNNTASTGGAIYGPTTVTSSQSYVNVYCSTFLNNIASNRRGGAVSAGQYGTYVFENTSFIGNQATSTSSTYGLGGAVDSRANTRITNSRLIANSGAGTTNALLEHLSADWPSINARSNWWQNPPVPVVATTY